MATVTITISDTETGTLKVEMSSKPAFKLKDEGKNTFAQNAGAYALEALMKKLKPEVDDEDEEDYY
jgi:hypothetical protein